MKVLFAVLLVLLLLVVALPMGMGHMGDCPSCTSAKAPFEIGLCAGILSLLVLSVRLSSSRLRFATEALYRFLLSLSIYRPPRLV